MKRIAVIPLIWQPLFYPVFPRFSESQRFLAKYGVNRMSKDDTKKRISQMCEFIKQEALEKANEIKIKTQEEFELDRQMLAQEGKMKVQEEYEKKEKDLQVQQRIAQSAEIGRQTKRRMVARDDLLNALYQDAKDRLAKLSLNDKEKYTAVLKDLILQGLIKIEEPDIVVRCRKVDMEIVRAVIPEVREKYIKMMKDECAMDVEVTVTLNEDEGKMLPPPPDGTPMISCSGGIIMEGHSGRLVLDNTFDKRLEVCFHDLKPVTRKCLFPSCYACLFTILLSWESLSWN